MIFLSLPIDKLLDSDRDGRTIHTIYAGICSGRLQCGKLEIFLIFHAAPFHRIHMQHVDLPITRVWSRYGNNFFPNKVRSRALFLTFGHFYTLNRI